MKVWLPVFRSSIAFLLLVIGPIVPRLSAGSVVSYGFSGAITSVSQAATNATGVVVGDTISGSFAYDSTQTGSATTGTYTFTGSSKVHSMSFKIFNAAGQQVFSDSYSGNVSAYYAAQLAFNSSVGGSGKPAETLDLKGDTVYKQGLGITGPNPPAFDLTLYNPNVTTKPASFPLPTTSTITGFVANNQQPPFQPTLMWDPPDQTFTAVITEFTDLSGIPEPSSFLLGAVAVAVGVAGCVLRRR
jgi:hypothetical protein